MFDCFRGRCPKYFGDVYTAVHTVAARSRLRSAHDWDQSSFHVCGRPDLAAAASAFVVRQFGTNFHGICEAQTPRNSLSVALSAGYSSVRTAGGASDRRWLKARRTNELIYLLQELFVDWGTMTLNQGPRVVVCYLLIDFWCNFDLYGVIRRHEHMKHLGTWYLVRFACT